MPKPATRRKDLELPTRLRQFASLIPSRVANILMFLSLEVQVPPARKYSQSSYSASKLSVQRRANRVDTSYKKGVAEPAVAPCAGLFGPRKSWSGSGRIGRNHHELGSGARMTNRTCRPPGGVPRGSGLETKSSFEACRSSRSGPVCSWNP